jgi:hypothetical protein
MGETPARCLIFLASRLGGRRFGTPMVRGIGKLTARATATPLLAVAPTQHAARSEGVCLAGKIEREG